MEADLLESRAYLSLSGSAPQVLALFMLKRQYETIGGKRRGKQGRVCINSNSLSLTYIEAEKKYGITQPRFTRAIDELLAKGFLACVHQGGAYQQDKSRFGLSDKWRLWKPGTVFEVRPREPLKRGFREPKKIALVQN